MSESEIRSRLLRLRKRMLAHGTATILRRRVIGDLVLFDAIRLDD